MKKFQFLINLLKVDKAKLGKSDKGTWLNETVFLNDFVDEYGSIGFIDERATPGNKETILGQIKMIEEKPKTENTPNDLPF